VSAQRQISIQLGTCNLFLKHVETGPVTMFISTLITASQERTETLSFACLSFSSIHLFVSNINVPYILATIRKSAEKLEAKGGRIGN